MERYIWFVLLSVHSTLQQQYDYQQPFVAMPSKPCVGEAVTLRCEVLVTVDNNTELVSAVIERGGEDISNIPNHMLLRNGVDIVGVKVINITLENDGVEYTCDATGAPPNFNSSLILNVTAPPTAPTINTPTMLSNRSFTVNWTIIDCDHNYIVTWTNLQHNNETESELISGNSYMVRGLTGVDNYNVRVTANNSCGMMTSDPMTVYGEPNDAPSNVEITEKTSESLYVQWEEVMDIFSIKYIVKWNGEDGSSGMNTVEDLSYNVTELTPNTLYTVTVAAINTCCGNGPESDPIMNMTDMGPSNPAATVSVLVSPDPSVLPSSDDDDPNSAGIIIGVVVGVICAIIIIIIIIIVICYIKKKKGVTDNSDRQELKSPTTSTMEGHKGGKASVQPSSVPHQTTDAGVEYAVTSKAVSIPQQQQPPAQEYAMVDKSKKKNSAANQGIMYADLQDLPAGAPPPANQGPTSTYAMVA